LLVETDVLFAHIKEKDWLKKSADALLRLIDDGSLGTVYASREVVHELYYLAPKVGWDREEALSRIGSLTRIRNLEWPATTTDVDLLALSLLATYDLSSIFDAYHAAACLLFDPEHLLVSTDETYDKIKSLRRLDPKAATEKRLPKRERVLGSMGRAARKEKRGVD
jgi:predicted nucleic acid-binding protein